MRKLVTMLLLLIFASSVWAIINGMTPGERAEGKTRYEIGIKVEQGWNLIPAAPTPKSNSVRAGDVQKENILAVYSFDPATQKYVEIHPNPPPARVTTAGGPSPDDLASQSQSRAFWIYVNKAGYLRYAPYTSLLDLPLRQLYPGWNFIAITPDFRGRQFQDIFADCTVEKSFSYNNRVYAGHTAPSWERVRGETTFTADVEGTGIVVKLTEECRMTSSENVTPPQLPS